MEEEKVRQLAQTLKNQGLAVSMYDATEMAKSILNVKPVKSGEQQENNEELQNSDWDITKEDATLNELMREVGVEPEQVEEQENKKRADDIKEEINETKEGIKEADENPEKTATVGEEISMVREEINEIGESKAEEQQESKKQSEQKDMFEEEKTVDLAKLFSNKK